MIGKSGVRNLLESCGGDPMRFAARWGNLLGVRDASGRRHLDPAGNMRLVNPSEKAGRINISEVHIRGLAEALLGEQWQDELRRIPEVHRITQAMGAGGVLDLVENASAAAAMPSHFANINAFTASIVGLLEVSILEAYQNPSYIGDILAPAMPSRAFEGLKKIGTTRIGDQAESREPGNPTKRVNVGERWMVQPRTEEYSLSSVVTMEAMFLDLTGGQLAENAGAPGVGEWLRYRRELRQIDSFIGVTQSYNYKGTSYNTYLTSGYYDNDFSNELLWESDIEEVLLKFRDMKDPETNTRILVQPTHVLVQRGKLRTARAIIGDTARGVELRTDPAAATAGQNVRVSEPAYGNNFTILESPLVYERIAATDGLAQTAENSEKWWWMFQPGLNTHVYVQNWPLKTETVTGVQDMSMVDHQIVLYVRASERGTPWWIEPRRSVRCKH